MLKSTTPADPNADSSSPKMNNQSTSKNATTPSTKRNIVAVSGYMFCSALMLIANKLAIHFIPCPAFVLFCQLAG